MAAISPEYGMPRIVGRPIRVHWAGWETDTFRLQQAGWQISAQQDPYRHKMAIAIQHRQSGMKGISQAIDFGYERHAFDLSGDELRHLILPMKYLACDIALNVREILSVHEFQAVDCTPALMDGPKRFEDLFHFPAPLVRTQEIVVADESVDELLSRILEKQQTAKQQFFEDRVRRQIAEERMAAPQAKVHAQIISFERKAA